MSREPFAIETSTIGMVLWNPTNDDLDMQYAGVSLMLKAGVKQAFEINCAKHLLNGYGQRGLTSLKFGDDSKEKEIGEAAIKRCEEFKKKQVVEYNQRNESRQMMKLSYLPPTPHIKKYAMELGLKLLEPYSVRDEERAGITKANEENEQLKAQLAEQGRQMKEMQAMMQKLLEKQEDKPAHPGNPNWNKQKG